METVYISIGSNLGDRVQNSIRAIEGISEFAEVTAVSSFYETDPVGNEDQPPFINSVVEIKTDLSPHRLLQKLHSLEKKLGRLREIKWGPRTIDLDVIFYGNLTIKDSDLIIPHPEAHKRRFVLEPMEEIAPKRIHPSLKQSISELLKKLKDPHKVMKINPPINI